MTRGSILLRKKMDCRAPGRLRPSSRAMPGNDIQSNGRVAYGSPKTACPRVADGGLVHAGRGRASVRRIEISGLEGQMAKADGGSAGLGAGRRQGAADRRISGHL